MHIKSKFLKNIIFPFADLVSRTKIIYFYDLINEMQKWSRTDIYQWQFDHLKKLLTYAYAKSEFYKHIFDEKKILPADFKSIDDIKHLPVITKEIIKSNWNKIALGDNSGKRYKFAATGGSTGSPLKYLLDIDTWSYISANRLFYWEKSGYHLGDKHISLGSSSLFPVSKRSLKHELFYFLKGKIPLNGVNMSDEVITYYFDFIKQKNIKFINGYASSIFLLADFSQRNPAYKLLLNTCIPTSEILTDHYRKTIHKAFNCKILDAYGAADGGLSAYNLNGYFEVGYNSLIYVNNNSELIKPIYVTDLFNYAFPIINYEVGDEVEINNETTYAYNGQIIKKVMGRISEIIRLSNGRVLTGPGFTILFKDLDIKAYRITKLNDLAIKCEIIPGQNYDKNQEDMILGTLKKHAGVDCSIQILQRDLFEQNISGKRNYFIS
jgi:phenylacetate-CoA ligase